MKMASATANSTPIPERGSISQLISETNGIGQAERHCTGNHALYKLKGVAKYK
jgi:hypothetical protein